MKAISLSSLVVAAALASVNGNTAEIFNDTFDSGTGAWYRAYVDDVTANNITSLANDDSGRLSFDAGLATGVGAYELIGRSFASQTIGVGETITIFFDFRQTSATGILRVGLYDLSEGAFSADEWARTNTGTYAGYTTFIRDSGTNITRREVANFTVSDLSGYPTRGDTGIVNAITTDGGDTNFTFQNDTDYQFTFSITRVSETQTDTLLTVMEGVTTRYSVGGSYTSDSGDQLGDFNTAVLRVNSGTALFDNVRVLAPLAAAPQLTITPAVAPATGYDLVWNSQEGKLYNLRTSTALDGPISGWNILLPGIAATPPANLVNVQADGPRRFYAVEEFDAPPLLEETFEEVAGSAPPAGWTRTDNGAGTVWEVGTPAGVPAETGVPDAAAVGTQCAGTNINDQYTPNAEASLISPAFTVPLSGATLAYWQYIDTEAAPSGDLGSIRLLNAADNSFLADVVTGIEGVTTQWSQQSVDLPAAAEGLEVKLEFHFVSDEDSINWAGFYIDDVVVTAK